MEELRKLLHKLQFDYYDHGVNMHTIIPDSDIKPILEYIKKNFVPLDAEVKPEIAEIDKMIDDELLRSKIAVERQNYGWATEAIVADAGVSILRKLKRRLTEQFSV